MPKLRSAPKKVDLVHPFNQRRLTVLVEPVDIVGAIERRRYFVGAIQVATALIRSRFPSVVWFTSQAGSTEFKDERKIIPAIVKKLES